MNDPTYFALLEACAQPGCPVCRSVHDLVEHFLDGLFYEMVNDAGMRKKLRCSLGFCKLHVHLLLDTQLRDPLGLTIIYHDILGHILDDLSKVGILTEKTSPLDILLGRLPKSLANQAENSIQALSPQGICPACQQQEMYAHLFVQSLLEHLQGDALDKAFEASSGLCLPHFRLALVNIHSSDQFNRLATLNRMKLQALRAELAEFIRKSDYRFSKEGFREEGNAYSRVMEIFVGTE
jgi:DNA-directed RNA polymerase specialized sigma54-like protein